jgi:hypothetical protein
MFGTEVYVLQMCLIVHVINLFVSRLCILNMHHHLCNTAYLFFFFFHLAQSGSFGETVFKLVMNAFVEMLQHFV